MSNLLIVVIRKDKLFILNAHYREILTLLNEDKPIGPSFPLDSGYLLIDHNTATVISNQSAFTAADIQSRVLKRFSWVVL